MSQPFVHDEATMSVTPAFGPEASGLVPVTILSIALALLAIALRLLRVERLLRSIRTASPEGDPGSRHGSGRGNVSPTEYSIPAPIGGIVESALACGGKSTQEDACAHLALPGCNLVVVADGVSGTSNAGMAARTGIRACVEFVSLALIRGASLGPATIREAFRCALDAIALEAQLNRWDSNPPATTLILALETRQRFLLGYSGDGAAVLLRGGLQWMTNLLHPHTGRAGAITRCLSADSDAWEPAILDLPKGWPDGGLLLIGTDGALVPGKVLETAQNIVAEVREAVTNSAPTETRAVHAVLDEWVSRTLKTDDNRSLGLLVSAEALSFWKSQE